MRQRLPAVGEPQAHDSLPVLKRDNTRLPTRPLHSRGVNMGLLPEDAMPIARQKPCDVDRVGSTRMWEASCGDVYVGSACHVDLL
jgi:hypothetical protein